ncbi:MAG: hypothetical protein PVH63_03965 [Balneolaceae bacterium]|jgi:hypothetical protein
MLFISSEGGSRQLRSLAQADTLIQRELAAFNISDQQLRVTTLKINSNFSRKIYHVGVPFEFSKTQLHAELNNTFYNFDIQTPARVSFPQKDVHIELVYQGTVIRTISLQTDPDLILNKNKINILVSFKDIPDEELINQLAAMGEPIPIVLQVESPMEANELAKKLKPHYRHILFWLQNGDGEDLIKSSPNEAVNKLKQIEDIMPNASMLLLSKSPQTEAHKAALVAKTNIAFIDASSAMILNEDMGKASFREGLDKLANGSSYSMALIMGNETTLSWLRRKIPELKKAGIDITYPPKTHL